MGDMKNPPEGVRIKTVDVFKGAKFDPRVADRAAADASEALIRVAEARVGRPLPECADNAAREQFVGVVVYLFGAIAHDPLYSRRFKEAQTYCEKWGMTVLNPTRHPVDRSGRLSYDFYMQHSVLDILACEVMVPVPSPYLEDSKGAAAERAYGVCLGRKILDGFIPWEG